METVWNYDRLELDPGLEEGDSVVLVSRIMTQAGLVITDAKFVSSTNTTVLVDTAIATMYGPPGRSAVAKDSLQAVTKVSAIARAERPRLIS